MRHLLSASCAWLALGALALEAQSIRSDYRVVYASARQLASQLDAKGRDGYACTAVAQSDPGIGVPGVVVALGRIVGGTHAPVENLAIVAGGGGTDLQAPLERAGADGFRLCGLVLDEEPPTPVLVAVLTRIAAPVTMRYAVEVLTNYKSSLRRLNDAGRDGFVPVAAAQVNNNRVPDMRSWLVVSERSSDRAAPREIAVRSASGPERLQSALNEQGALGFRVDLLWKEGQDVVAMMSKAAGGDKEAHAYSVDVIGLDRIHSLPHLYLGDFSYLSGDDRMVVSDRDVSASNDVEENELPRLGGLGYADPSAAGLVGDRLSRHHGFAPAALRVHRGPHNSFVLSTALTDSSK